MALSRRDFLKMGGSACIVVGAGAALAGCSPSTEKENKGEAAAAGEYVVGAADINWAKETEILIIGTGIAGLAAAMKPALEGKKITFVDKMHTWGGDSVTSCYFMFGNGTKPQLAVGMRTFEEYWEASKEKAQAAYPEFEWYPAWIEGRTRAMTKWVDSCIDDFGATFQEPATPEELPRLNASVILPGHGIASGTEDILIPVYNKLKELGCEFIMDTRATALIKNTEGAVLGCRFIDQNSGEIVDIKAQATVLATGCFINNQEMMVEYEPNYAPYGQLVNYSTGDGQLMAAAAGAQLFNMYDNYANLMGDIPNATTWGYWAPIVLVLPNGKRFIEEAQSHDAAQAAVDAGYREWWVIFDQQAIDARCVADSVQKNIKGNADVYRTANTVEELAVAMDVPVDQLVATFKRYEELVDGGEDTDFGKTAHLKKLVPPYHALKENVVRYKTIGGVIVNDKNLVLDEKNEPIPNLYACGAVTTLSSSSVSVCAATGYFVGESLCEALGGAAAEGEGEGEKEEEAK
ncbi:MAG: FAD-dependent oxidoreductase [Eggerthellaceae bacterium]|nr:FAD-dependent oxidoreductase [Eggerthellaceae bacterium]